MAHWSSSSSSSSSALCQSQSQFGPDETKFVRSTVVTPLPPPGCAIPPSPSAPPRTPSPSHTRQAPIRSTTWTTLRPPLPAVPPPPLVPVQLNRAVSEGIPSAHHGSRSAWATPTGVTRSNTLPSGSASAAGAYSTNLNLTDPHLRDTDSRRSSRKLVKPSPSASTQNNNMTSNSNYNPYNQHPSLAFPQPHPYLDTSALPPPAPHRSHSSPTTTRLPSNTNPASSLYYQPPFGGGPASDPSTPQPGQAASRGMFGPRARHSASSADTGGAKGKGKGKSNSPSPQASQSSAFPPNSWNETRRNDGLGTTMGPMGPGAQLQGPSQWHSQVPPPPPPQQHQHQHLQHRQPQRVPSHPPPPQRKPTLPEQPELDEALRQSRDEAELLRAQRLSALAEEDRLLRLTSSYSAEQEEIRQQRLRKEALEEEEILRKALMRSREEKGKARQREDEERREREEMEMVLRLSLQEEERRWRGTASGGGRGGAETSAQMFERLSRVDLEDERREVDDEMDGGRGGIPVASTSSSNGLHDAYQTSQPSASTSSPQQQQRPHSSFHITNPDNEDLPPAYEYPAPSSSVASVTVLGPGRSLPAVPSPTPDKFSRPSPQESYEMGRDYSSSSSTSVLAPTHPVFEHPSPSSSSSRPVPSASLLTSTHASPHPQHQRSNSLHQTPISNTAAAFYSAPIAAIASGSGGGSGSGMNGNGTHGHPTRPMRAPPPPPQPPQGMRNEEEEEHDDDEDDGEDPFKDPEVVEMVQGGNVNGIRHVHANGSGEALRVPSKVVDWGSDSSDDDSTSRGSGRNGGTERQGSPPKDLWARNHSHSLSSSNSASHSNSHSTATSISSSPIIPLTSPQILVASPPSSPHGHLLSPPPLMHHSSSSTSSTSLRSSPLFGGLVDSASTNAIADDSILDGVRFGFLPANSGRPILEHEGTFPDVAQLSRVGGPEGDSDEFRTFAVEAVGWQGLLSYLMWHGNSRLEVAPRDIQQEKTGRGLEVAIVLEFFRRSDSPFQPRVRCRLDLLAPMHSYDPLSETFTSESYPSFTPDRPNIIIRLPNPPLLPLNLSSLAMTLSAAHSLSRKRSHHHQNDATVRAVRHLAAAVDLFKMLNGEVVEGNADEVEDEERHVLSRLKSRLKWRKRGPGLVKGGADGTGNGRPLEGGGMPLPEGALMVNPFRLDDP
ncbi:hypothetical protein T439DRAFT_352620 [Meredithblackwellia eburnea MCA 4105]